MNIALVNSSTILSDLLKKELFNLKVADEVFVYKNFGELAVSGNTDLQIIVGDIPVLSYFKNELTAGEKAYFISDIKFILIANQLPRVPLNKARAIGIDGFLTPLCSLGELLEAIEHVSKGMLFFSEEMKDLLLNFSINKDDAGAAGITEQENAVILLLSEGATGKEIEHRLGISANWLQRTKNSIVKKLKLENKKQIVAYGVRRDIKSQF